MEMHSAENSDGIKLDPELISRMNEVFKKIKFIHVDLSKEIDVTVIQSMIIRLGHEILFLSGPENQGRLERLNIKEEELPSLIREAEYIERELKKLI